MSHLGGPSARSQQRFVDDGLQVVALSDANHGKEVVPYEIPSGSQKQIFFSNEEKEPVESLEWHGQSPIGPSKNHAQRPSKKSRCVIMILVILVVIVLVVTAAMVTVVEVRKRQSSQSQT